MSSAKMANSQSGNTARKLFPLLHQRVARVQTKALSGLGARALFDQACLEHFLQATVRRGVWHTACTDQSGGCDYAPLEVPAQQEKGHSQVRIRCRKLHHILQLVAKLLKKGDDLKHLGLGPRRGEPG